MKWALAIAGLGLAGVASADPIGADFSPNPKEITTFQVTTAVEAAKVIGQYDSNCSNAVFAATPTAVLELKDHFAKLKISLTDGQFVLIKMGARQYVCKRGHDVTLELAAGRVEVFAGAEDPGAQLQGKLLVEDLPRSTAAAAASAAAEIKRHDDRAALCKDAGDPVTGDLTRGLGQAIACNTGAVRILRYAWRGIDDGNPSPLFPAAAVAVCGDHQQNYAEWRYCDAIGKSIDDAKLATAVATELIAEAREPLLAGYHKGKQAIEAARTQQEEHGIGYPDDKQRFDAAFAAAKAWPNTPELRALVTEIEQLVVKLDKGPGFAKGCVEQLGPKLQALVTASGAMLDAFKTPTGSLLVDALAGCHGKLGEPSIGSAFAALLDGHPAITGFHDALWQGFRGVRFFDDVDLDHHPLRRTPHVPAGHLDTSSGLVVAAVKVTGDRATITFKKSSELVDVPYDCVAGKISSLTESSPGTVTVNRDHSCKYRKQREDTTPKPITVPVAETATIAPGVQIASDQPEASIVQVADARPVHVVWVKRGKDLVWVLGFTR